MRLSPQLLSGSCTRGLQPPAGTAASRRSLPRLTPAAALPAPGPEVCLHSVLSAVSGGSSRWVAFRGAAFGPCHSLSSSAVSVASLSW